MSNDSELLHDIAKGVQGPIDAALAELSTFGTVARTLLAIAEQSGRRPGRADLAKIREHLQTQLRGPDSATAGIGIAVGVDYLHDSPYWLEWWRFGRRGELEFVAHSLNPNRDAFMIILRGLGFRLPQLPVGLRSRVPMSTSGEQTLIR